MGIRGIDVSSYQGKINWQEVKDDGIEFVLIRAGWGKDSVDPRFKKNLEDALEVNLNIGVYWYMYAKNSKDIVANAEKFDSVILPYKGGITMGVWGSWQYDSDKYKQGNATRSMTKKERTEWVKLFCETLKKKGYDAGLFADVEYLNKRFNDISEYPLWLNHCATSCDGYSPTIWQKSTTGKVNGITTRVDIDEYMSEKEITVASPVRLPKSYPTLQRGMKSTYVKVLLSKLQELGYDVNRISDVFSPDVLRLVLQFQNDNGLDADGIVNSQMWETLYK